MLRYIYLLMNSTDDVWECVQVIFIPSSWGRLNPKRNKDHSSDTLIASLQAAPIRSYFFRDIPLLKVSLIWLIARTWYCHYEPFPWWLLPKTSPAICVSRVGCTVAVIRQHIFYGSNKYHGILIQDKHIVNYSYTLDNKVCSVKLC